MNPGNGSSIFLRYDLTWQYRHLPQNVYRQEPKQTQAIIVRFKSYRTKKALYGVRKCLKNQNMSHIFQDAGIVYINENLTRMQRELFAKVWRRKKLEQWHSAWTIDGKIFMKLSLDDQPVRIYSQEDLDRI